jgi:hypothetical protein
LLWSRVLECVLWFSKIQISNFIFSWCKNKTDLARSPESTIVRMLTAVFDKLNRSTVHDFWVFFGVFFCFFFNFPDICETVYMIMIFRRKFNKILLWSRVLECVLWFSKIQISNFIFSWCKNKTITGGVEVDENIFSFSFFITHVV